MVLLNAMEKIIKQLNADLDEQLAQEIIKQAFIELTLSKVGSTCFKKCKERKYMGLFLLFSKLVLIESYIITSLIIKERILNFLN